MRVVAKKKFADGTRKDSDDYASVEVLEQMGLHRSRSAPDPDVQRQRRILPRTASQTRINQLATPSPGGGSARAPTPRSGGGARRSGGIFRTLLMFACLIITYAVVHAILSPRWSQLIDDNKGALQAKVADLQSQLRETKGLYAKMLQQRGEEQLTASHGGSLSGRYSGERASASVLRLVMSRALLGILFFMSVVALKCRDMRALDARMLHVPLQELIEEEDTKVNKNAHFLDPFDLMRSDDGNADVDTTVCEEERLVS